MSDPYLQQMLAHNEEILLVTHKHWSILVLSVITEMILAVGIAVLVVLVAIQSSGLALWGLLLLVIPGTSFIRDYLIWESHKYVVTNRRVIQMMGVINKNVTDSSLEKVNDVKLEQSFMGRLFDYGDIQILTASELGINKFTRINEPIRFKTAMLDAKGKLEGLSNGTSSNANQIRVILSQLDDLQKMGILSEEEYQQKKANLLDRI